jgi:hypothetical protein
LVDHDLRDCLRSWLDVELAALFNPSARLVPRSLTSSQGHSLPQLSLKDAPRIVRLLLRRPSGRQATSLLGHLADHRAQAGGALNRGPGLRKPASPLGLLQSRTRSLGVTPRSPSTACFLHGRPRFVVALHVALASSVMASFSGLTGDPHRFRYPDTALKSPANEHDRASLAPVTATPRRRVLRFSRAIVGARRLHSTTAAATLSSPPTSRTLAYTASP